MYVIMKVVQRQTYSLYLLADKQKARKIKKECYSDDWATHELRNGMNPWLVFFPIISITCDATLGG